MERKAQPQRMIERSTGDDNFAHCIALIGMTLGIIDHLKAGQRVSFNDINCIHLPAEVLKAFMKREVETCGPLGDACREALDRADELDRLWAVKGQ